MVLWTGNGWRLTQHHLLNIFYVQKWQEGDNPRSYGRHWDYFTQETFNNLEEAKKFLKEKI